MNRFFTAIILLLVAGSALAASVGMPTDITHAWHQSFAPPASDYSVAYLSQIFGTVGNVLSGSSGQTLGVMFAIFNKGVMAVAAIWLAYTTITLVLRGAQEGSFMGHNRNVAVILLRIALGFALIIPSPATGYSVLQAFFMKVVIEGVGLADATWNAALNYWQYGGSLYIPPSTLSTDPNVITSAISGGGVTASAAGPVSQIFQNEVCMIQSDAWEKQLRGNESSGNSTSSPFIATSSSLFYSGSYHPIFDKKAGMIYFPGVGNSANAPNSINKDNAQCGYVESYWTVSQSTTAATSAKKSTFSQEQQDAMQAYSWQALEQLVNDMVPAAQLYVDKLAKLPSKQYRSVTENQQVDTIQSEVNGAVFTAILGYANLITPYQKILTSPATSDNLLTQFIQNAKTEGWIMAGSFFWAVEQINSESMSADISKLFPIPYKSPLIAGSNPGVTPAPSQYLADALNNIKNSETALTTLWGQYLNAQTSGAYSQQTPSGAPGVATIILVRAKAQVDGLAGEFILGRQGNFNPIAALMNEGNRMLNIALGLWIGSFVLTLTIGFAMGICQSTSPGGATLQVVLAWAKALTMAICYALIVPGVILAYYVPIYPFAVFTFAAIGWIVLVIEGMAAAPLVCMGLTHPENHDFLGKAEQALMLFVSIFVRPALMIIGLVASMLLSFVAFALLSAGFGNLMFDMSGSGAFSNPFLGLFTTLIIFVIFGFLTMEIIEQSYKLIYQLPNNIMQWIGGPQTGQDFGQMAAGLRSAVSGAGSSMQQGMHGIEKGTAKAHQNLGEVGGKKAKQAKGGGGENDVTGSTGGS